MSVRGVEREEAVYRESVRDTLAVLLVQTVPGVRLTSGLMATVGFGLPLLAMPGLMDGSPAYLTMAAMAPGWLWGLVWIMVGFGQLAGMFGIGFRRQADFAAAVLWLFWAYTVVLSIGVTTVAPTYGTLAALSMLASISE